MTLLVVLLLKANGGDPEEIGVWSEILLKEDRKCGQDYALREGNVERWPYAAEPPRRENDFGWEELPSAPKPRAQPALERFRRVLGGVRLQPAWE